MPDSLLGVGWGTWLVTTSEAEAVIIEIKSANTFNWWSCQVFNSGHHLSPLMATRLAFAWYCDFYENIGIICREKAFAGYHDTLTFMKILTSSAERKKNWVIIAALIWQRFRILELRHKANVLGRIWNGPKFQIAENEKSKFNPFGSTVLGLVCLYIL